MIGNHYIGWDIGGAHLKVARLAGDGTILEAAQYATPLWRGLEQLHEHLAHCSRGLRAAATCHALTMTGELVDHFPDRDTGVRKLIDAFVSHVPEAATRVFAGGAGFLPVSDARRRCSAVASANWLATARCVARQFRDAILVDVGSTTTDLIPIRDHVPCHAGSSDRERLQQDELVYTGVVRTPVMALAQRAPVAGRWQNLAAEQFATTADVYRITGELGTGADLHDSADQREKTVPASMARLARMAGAEFADAEPAVWTALAHHLAHRQQDLLDRAFVRIRNRHDAGRPVTVIGTGAGAFLARKLADAHGCAHVDFARLFPSAGVSAGAIDTCAPAVAVADLVLRGPAP